ncbi:MAG: fumarylacetoacetate hydrolase family protein [Candidatus Lernaella stagnicola]|nr:fumarylacetoacetate hydrolase family protein [Candidatus Lernaella stagnicola]
MKLVRFLTQCEDVRVGSLEGNHVRDLGTDMFSGHHVFGHIYPLQKVRLLAPVIPGKIIGIGLNYRDHAQEMGREVPEQPDIFLKPSTSVIGPEDAIEIPAASRRVEIESELAVVVAARLCDATVEEAAAGILGYTIINDVTARDLQRNDRTWTRGKAHDTFAPLGPCIVTDLDVSDLLIEGYINKERKQQSRTSNMLHSVPELLSYVSHIMTLVPGDVVATGTPAGVSAIVPGDTVEIVIEGIGRLRNPVVARGAKEETS